jgi:hypothetical protein
VRSHSVWSQKWRIATWATARTSPFAEHAALLTLVAAAIAGLLRGLKVTRGIATRPRHSRPGGAGLRFGGIWTVLIVLQVAAMATVAHKVRSQPHMCRAADTRGATLR